jgi:hypothetical protein
VRQEHVQIDRMVTVDTPRLIESLHEYDEIVRRIRAAKTAQEVETIYGIDPVRRWPHVGGWSEWNADSGSQQVLYCKQRDLRYLVRKRIEDLDPIPPGVAVGPSQGMTRGAR